MDDTQCRRALTLAQMIAGLRAGKRLRVDRRDAPELPELLELEFRGFVKQRMVVVEEQYSYAEFTWKEQVMKCTVLTTRGPRVPEDVVQMQEMPPHAENGELTAMISRTIQTHMMAHPDFTEIHVTITQEPKK